MHRRRAVGALALALILTGCGSSATSPSAPAQGKTQQVVAMVDAGSDSYAYKPKTIRVTKGTKVTFINRSSAPHSVTPRGATRAFTEADAKQIEPKKSWAFTFSKPGTYAYYCIFHPYMLGKVIVSG